MDIQNYYKYSIFANLAYVNWRITSWGINGNFEDALFDANKANRIPGDATTTPGVIDTLGEKIFQTVANGGLGWRVADFHPDDKAGFAASLFVNEATGEKVLGIRGTDPGNDLFADLIRADVSEIGGLGIAVSQAISLFNYVQRLKAEKDATGVLQLELQVNVEPPQDGTRYLIKSVGRTVLYYSLKRTDAGTGLGLIGEGDQLTITGHSLGGHLAVVGQRLFPDLFDQTVTYNAPGFDPITSWGWAQRPEPADDFFDLFTDFGIQPADSFSDPAIAAKIHTLESEDAIPGDDSEFVSSILTGADIYGEEQFIATEHNSHLIEPFMDSLAVQALLEKLDPDIGTAGAMEQMEAASNNPDRTDESIVDALSALLLQGDSAGKLDTIDITEGLLAYFDNPGDLNKRAELHSRIIELEQKIDDTPGLRLQSLIHADPTELKLKALGDPRVLDNAEEAIAYRYALEHLTPFVITGNNTIYDDHNKGQELDLYNPDTGKGALTDIYLTDRAAFLTDLINASRKDIDTLPDAKRDRFYADAEEGISLHVGSASSDIYQEQYLFGRDGTGIKARDSLFGLYSSDHLYGRGGKDTLAGRGGSDYLEGGAGDDILFHNDDKKDSQDDFNPAQNGLALKGIDTLKGGPGRDTYYVGRNDIIDDSDRKVKSINFNGKLVNGTYEELAPGSGAYRNLSNGLLLTVSGTEATVKNLKDHSVFTIKNFKAADQPFQPGDYGIVLSGQTPPTEPITAITPGDDVLGVDETAMKLEVYDAVGGNVVGTVTYKEPIRKLEGQAGDDVFQIDADIPGLVVYGDNSSGATPDDGDDYIDIDRLNVHDGVTPADVGAGARIHGQGGDDFVSGSQRNDEIAGGPGHDFLRGNAGEDILRGDAGNDWLEGSGGNDLLQGADGNDRLLGGAGTDTLSGGDGNDRLWGDAGGAAYYRIFDTGFSFWDGARELINPFDDPFITDEHIIEDAPLGSGGTDLLDGGAGDDLLFGGEGNDSLLGGAGQDILQGEAGDDFLLGGAGKDILWGDKDPASYQSDTAPLAGAPGFIFRQHADAMDVTGNDVLDGGPGNDILRGGAGDDTYQFGYGYGVDIVEDIQGNDRVRLADGITPADVVLDGGTGQGDLSLALQRNGIATGDVLIVSGWFSGKTVEAIEFAAGTVWDRKTIESMSGVNADPDASPVTVDNLLSGTDLLDVSNLTDAADEYYGLGGDDHVSGGSGRDRLHGGAGDDVLRGNDDDDDLDGGRGADLLFGDGGDDLLAGGPGNDRLQGGTGNDRYRFNRGDGEDVIFDEAGDNDILLLGPGIGAADLSPELNGNDLVLTVLDQGRISKDQVTISDWANPAHRVESIQFNDGSSWDSAAIQARLQEDIILVDGSNAQGSANASRYTFTPDPAIPDGFNLSLADAGGNDQLQFQQTVIHDSVAGDRYATPVLTGAHRDGNDLVLTLDINSDIDAIAAGSGHARLRNFYTAAGFIETIQVAGTVLNETNQAPVVNGTADDQIVDLNTTYNYQLTTDTFTDSPFDLLTFSAALANGGPLPGWLGFDAGTLTFSGTPVTGDEGLLDIRVTARDSGGLENSTGFSINVGAMNLAPEVVHAMGDQSVKAGEVFTLVIPDNTFADANVDDRLSLSLASLNGPVPGWLHFDPATHSLSGTPDANDAGKLDLAVVARDDAGLSAVDTFTLEVRPFNTAPLAQPDHARFTIGSADTALVDVLANDSDEDAGDDPSSFVLTDAVLRAGDGTVSIKDNRISFAPGAAYQDLKAGESAAVAIDYTMADAGGAASSSTLTLVLRGSRVEVDSSLADTFSVQNGARLVSGAGDVNGDGFADVMVLSAGLVGNNAAVVFGSETGPDRPLDVMALDGSNGFQLTAGLGKDIQAFHNAGDVNGDGIDDLIIGAPLADATGVSSVVFGSTAGFNAVLNLDTLDGANGFRLTGSTAGGGSGFSVAGAGDVNGDGIDDLLIGAPNEGSAGEGESYIVYGNSSGFDAVLDLSSLNGDRGVRLDGPEPGVSSGHIVAGIGDINGDGFDDFLSCQDMAGNGGELAGVVFGGSAGAGSLADLSTLDGENGFQLVSASGAALTSADTAGDFNGDGLEDFIVASGAAGTAGESYVVFGRPSGFAANLDLDSLDGTDGFRIPGLQPGDMAGAAVSGAGDINGDGFDDLIIGAPFATPEGGAAGAGECYVIFGRDGGFEPIFDLATLNAGNGLRLSGINAFDHAGASVSGAGDLNGDGFDDLVIAADGANYIVYGRDYLNQVEQLGTSGDDIIEVTQNDQHIVSMGGADVIDVNEAVNVAINAGAGDDIINIEGGDNISIDAGVGNNQIHLLGSGASPTTHTTLNTAAGSNHVTVTTVADDRYILVSPSLQGGSGQVYDIYTQQEITNDQISFQPGSLLVDIGDGQVQLDFTGVDTGNLLNGAAPFAEITINDSLTITYESVLDRGFDVDGSAADDTLEGTEVTDRIRGMDGNDSLMGEAGDDTLDGGAGNDSLLGGSGDDVLAGGTGDDLLSGGAGDDTYLFNLGDGHDVITGGEGHDQVVFGAGISPSNISVERSNNDLVISLLDQEQVTADKLTIANWFGADTRYTDDFVFTDNNLTVLTSKEMESLINHAPELAEEIPDQAVDDGVMFNFTIPAGTFTDADSEDVLQLSTHPVDSSALPAWLTFDPVTGTFSGTPGFEDYGGLDLLVTATDPGGNSVSADFILTVNVPGAVVGTDGKDELVGGNGADTLIGLDGDDIIRGGNGNDRLAGGNGDDDMEGGNRDDVLYGGQGNDVLKGGNGEDHLSGGEGNDWLCGGNQADLLEGGAGDDILKGNNGSDVLLGGAGVDVLEGGNQADLLRGGAGDDLLDGGNGGDQLYGEDGNDRLTGGNQADCMVGGDGDDILDGQNGSDNLLGGAGNDILRGGNQADILDGGPGDDILQGGRGNDSYRFSPGDGVDTILDSHGNGDELIFTGISHEDLWFGRDGDNLSIGVLNTEDQLTIDGWYTSPGMRLETIACVDDGYVITENKVQQLVDAMAVFDVTESGDLFIPQQELDQLQPVIAAAWTPS